jgi:hypothetical protein
VAVSKVHPSHNPQLRDSTFRPIDRYAYRIRRVLSLTAVTAPDVSLVLVSKIHPSRNVALRDGTFEQADLDIYQPKHALPPALFVAGLLIVVSKIHPSRNIMLRDSTFRPPYLEYYQPKHTNAFNLAVVSTGLTEVLFKGMWRGMYRRMR